MYSRDERGRDTLSSELLSSRIRLTSSPGGARTPRLEPDKVRPQLAQGRPAIAHAFDRRIRCPTNASSAADSARRRCTGSHNKPARTPDSKQPDSMSTVGISGGQSKRVNIADCYGVRPACYFCAPVPTVYLAGTAQLTAQEIGAPPSMHTTTDTRGATSSGACVNVQQVSRMGTLCLVLCQNSTQLWCAQ
jgi:hypothetical protein